MAHTNKRGQSISINTIIIAAIALAVLVVLFAIFTGRMGGFTKGLQQTDTCAQKCVSLDMDFISGANEEKICGTDETYIAGTYADGKNGCCCREKI